MKHICLDIIADEHRALAAMLQSLLLMAKRPSSEATAGDFEIMRAMLLYIVEFPEKMHHTKETKYLFPMVGARCPELSEVILRLNAQHDRSEGQVLHLMHRLLAWEMMGEYRQQEFVDAVIAYLDFYLDHMHTENDLIIEAAIKVLDEDDWKVLDREFLSNRDPLTGCAPGIEYDKLFSYILYNAPQPIGLGRT